MQTPEERRAYIAAWKRADREKHPEKWQAIAKAERLKYRARRIANAKDWRRRNPERVKALNDLTHARNPHVPKPAQLRLVMPRGHKARRPADLNAAKERKRLWKLAHRDYLAPFDRARRATAKYRATHAVSEQRRRARKRGNGGTFTSAEWRDKCALLGNVCIYCGEAKPLTIDHKVPLSRGGTNDITNIVPACRDCNLTKRAMTAYEFIARKVA